MTYIKKIFSLMFLVVTNYCFGQNIYSEWKISSISDTSLNDSIQFFRLNLKTDKTFSAKFGKDSIINGNFKYDSVEKKITLSYSQNDVVYSIKWKNKISFSITTSSYGWPTGYFLEVIPYTVISDGNIYKESEGKYFLKVPVGWIIRDFSQSSLLSIIPSEKLNEALIIECDSISVDKNIDSLMESSLKEIRHPLVSGKILEKGNFKKPYYKLSKYILAEVSKSMVIIYFIQYNKSIISVIGKLDKNDSDKFRNIYDECVRSIRFLP